MSIDVEALRAAYLEGWQVGRASHSSASGALEERDRLVKRYLARLVPAEDERPIDYLAEKDRSAAEYSDTRSHCPRCGEWRDSPTSDCAACGFVPAEDEGLSTKEAYRLGHTSGYLDAEKRYMVDGPAEDEGRLRECDHVYQGVDEFGNHYWYAATPQPWTDPKG